MAQNMTRRDFLPIAGASLLSGYAGFAGARTRPHRTLASPSVAIVKARSYSEDLVSRILEGVRACGLDVRGQRVLLKPNLVEFDPNTCINTEVSVVAAAYEVFKTLGAAEVLIGEGPGHRRDTYAIAEMARYRTEIAKFDALFTDLNRDDVTAIQGFADRGEIYLPNTALRADLIVSLAKMKTHHWAAATLSMKNFFGLVPGSIYGWPKNELHFVGIDRSIVELNRIFRRSFAIVDGIVGMEGNGPIQGTPRRTGVVVAGADPVAVDATCCRIMRIDPLRVRYLRLAATEEQLREETIPQIGEGIAKVASPYALLPEREFLRLSAL